MRAPYRLLEDKEQHVARDLYAEVCVTSPASLLGLPWLVCECAMGQSTPESLMSTGCVLSASW